MSSLYLLQWFHAHDARARAADALARFTVAVPSVAGLRVHRCWSGDGGIEITVADDYNRPTADVVAILRDLARQADPACGLVS